MRDGSMRSEGNYIYGTRKQFITISQVKPSSMKECLSSWLSWHAKYGFLMLNWVKEDETIEMTSREEG